MGTTVVFLVQMSDRDRDWLDLASGILGVQYARDEANYYRREYPHKTIRILKRTTIEETVE